MVRYKEAKKSRARSHAQISGLDFFADAADRRFGAACECAIFTMRGENIPQILTRSAWAAMTSRMSL